MQSDVLIVGGGPFGLMLANDLGRRGISAILVDAKPSTAVNPQANATQARTMEHFRRMGFADEVRAMGLPPDYPTDVAYFTRYGTHELGRFRLPSSKEAHAMVSKNSGPWNAAEAPHRVSQKFVEAVLRRHAEKLPGISVNYGWKLTEFEGVENGVIATVEEVGSTQKREVRAAYLAAGDGARSTVRRQLGISYTGETGVVRDFFGGRMYAVYLRCPHFHQVIPHAPAWMHFTFNGDRRAFMAAVDGAGEFAFHTQLRDGEDENSITDADAVAMFQAAVGAPIDCEIISRMGWTAGHALVAERFQEGRVFLGGDAVHLFTPAGGLGYNTAIEDALNLGWKLAETLRGHAGPGLLESYELERKPIALRNTGYARGFAESIGLYVPRPGLEDDTEAGALLRAEAGEYLAGHGRREFNIPGITFGARYDGSPVIASDGAVAPDDRANEYVPSAIPGGRPPHYWIEPGKSLYDLFGYEWTLLRLGPDAPDGIGFVEAARDAGLAIDVASLPTRELADLYETPLALVRPDNVVAWRGDSDSDAGRIFSVLLGRGDA